MQSYNEDKKCKICGRETTPLISEGRDFFILKGKSDLFGIDYCNNCQLGFSAPDLDNQQLAQYYPEDYEAYSPKKNFLAFLQKIKYQNDLKMILREISGKNGLSMYEIGAGRGEFLSVAKTKGIDVSGSEPGKAGASYSWKNYGIELRNVFADEIKFSQKYDIIVLRHVLEHINDFDGCLKNIFNNGLADGGLLFLKLPRLDSWEAWIFGKYWSGYDLPRHRVHFSKAGITQLLQESGYGDIKVFNEAVPSDIVRSVSYLKIDKKNIFFTIFTFLPYIFQLFMAQTVCFALNIMGTGRMIVLARK